jgi:hypothetical protein
MCFIFLNFQIKFAIFTESYNFYFSQADKTTQKTLITFLYDLVLEQNLMVEALHVSIPTRLHINFAKLFHMRC